MTDYHPLVAIVSLLSLLLYFFMGMRVGEGRSKFGVAAPAVTGHPEFERLLPGADEHPRMAADLSGLAVALRLYWGDRIAALVGVVWIVGRILYMVELQPGRGEPRTRLPGAGAGDGGPVLRARWARSSGSPSTTGSEPRLGRRNVFRGPLPSEDCEPADSARLGLAPAVCVRSARLARLRRERARRGREMARLLARKWRVSGAKWRGLGAKGDGAKWRGLARRHESKRLFFFVLFVAAPR